MSTTEWGPLPCWIGFTGHRGIPASEAARLQAVLEDLFSTLQRQFPHTRIVVLSALAEGADRAAARAAIATDCKLVCPLPMDATRYRGTFAAATIEAFDALLKQAEPVVHLPGGASDTEAYAALGAWLCARSHLLIAALDPDDPGASPGGTAWVLHGRTGRRASGRDQLGPALVVPVHRSGGDPDRKPAAPAPLPRGFLDVLSELDRFNRHALRDGLGCTPDQLHLDRAFDAANRQADRAKKAHIADLVAVLAMGFVAFGAYEVYNAFYASAPGGWWVLLLFPLLLVIAWAHVLWARKRRTQDQHLEARVLAESLRVHRAWRAAGVHPDVHTVMAQTRLLLAPWLVEALRPSLPAERAHAVEAVVDSWVKDQADWFEARVAHMQARAEQLGVVVTVSLMLAGLGSLGLGWVHGQAARADIGPGLALFTTLCLAVAAVAGAFREKLLIDELGRRYQQHAVLFAQAHSRLAAILPQGGGALSAPDRAAAREILRGLGIEALAEHVQWLHLHSSRPLEPPA